MDALTTKLTRMKDQIEEDKVQKAQAEGRVQSYTAQRKQDFAVTTEKEAREKAAEIEKRIIEKENSIAERVRALETNYVWD